MKNYSNPNFKHQARKVTAKQAEQMTKMLAKGKSLTEVANKYGVCPATVKYNTDSAFRHSEMDRKKK